MSPSNKSKVFVSVTMSLDGFIAPEGTFGDKRWMSQWMELQRYVLQQKFFRQNLNLGDGGLEGEDNQLLEEVFRRTGTTIIGKRMFDAGEASWPEEAPFRTPVFVITHQKRDPWVRPGGTTFYFVNDGIEVALGRAREVAGDKDIRVGGGANVIQACLNAGLVDELHVALSPCFLGSGTRLFDHIDTERLKLEITGQSTSTAVTHLHYAVSRRARPT